MTSAVEKPAAERESDSGPVNRNAGTVIDESGAVVTLARRRERNFQRGVAAVTDAPVEAQLELLRPMSLDYQERGVEFLLSSARTGLLAAIAANDLPGMVLGRAKASAVEDVAKRLKLSREIQDDATVLVRRSERALGVAIRLGQAEGRIETVADKCRRATAIREMKMGRITENDLKRIKSEIGKIPLREVIADTRSLSNNKNGIFYFADGISDEQFEEALTESWAEGKLSRANVMRRLRAKVEDIPVHEPPKQPVQPVRKTAAGRKVIQDLIVTINSLVFVINDTDPQEIDYEAHKEDIKEIRKGAAAITKFLKSIENA